MDNERFRLRKSFRINSAALRHSAARSNRVVRFMAPILLGLGTSVALGFGKVESGPVSITISGNAVSLTTAEAGVVSGGMNAVESTNGESSRIHALELAPRNQFASSNPVPLSTFGWTNSRCNNCHQPEKLFSHPVGVVPTRAIPESFPLVKGKIECITCHVSESSDAHAAARDEQTALLRGKRSGADFCTNCHQQGSGLRRDMHAQVAGQAHLRWSQTATVRSFGGGVNPRGTSRPEAVAEEQTCLACHDGVTASEALHRSSRSRGRLLSGRDSGHPVGIPYQAKTSSVNGSELLLPESRLDERIRLFDGNVACGSCHSLYSKQNSLLVMSNRGSRLCLSCHDL